MNLRPLRFLATASPLALVLALIALKAICFFAVIPYFQDSIATLYGIDFADNYQSLGENLAEGNGYRFTVDTASTLMREPGYPLFLSALFAIFGYSLTAARAANLVLSFVSALIVSRIAGRISDNPLATRIAPLLFLVHPGVVVAELRGGVESLFIVLLLCFFLATYTALATRRFRDFFLAGLVLGIASTVRSTGLLFPAFLTIYFFFVEKVRPSLVVMGTRVAVMVAGSVLALLPWIIRNYELVGKFVPTGSVASVSAHAGYYICTNLTFHNKLQDVDFDAARVRAAIGRENGFKFKEMGDALYYTYFFESKDELAFNSMLGKQVMQHYKDDPLLLPTCALKNAVNFWVAGKSWTSTAMNALVQLPYLIFGIAGLVIGLRSRHAAMIWVPTIFIGYTLAVYIPVLAQARYSIPLVPLLSMFAAISLSRILSPATERAVDRGEATRISV